MPSLQNTRHERFAQELVKGASQAEAYVSAGYKPSRSAAARLAADVNICARVAEIQNRAAVRTEITLADIIDELEEARQIALGAPSPQTASAVAATMGKAKLLGLVVDKSQVEQTVEVTDARERLARIVAGHTAAGPAREGSGKPH
jgi:phage terminase small subunit